MNPKNIKIFRFKTLPYKTYLNLSEYFRKKRCENLVFCDHHPVITAGIQYKQESFKFQTDFISKQGVEIHYVKRGGDLTAHELGQIIIYPHIDLKKTKNLFNEPNRNYYQHYEGFDRTRISSFFNLQRRDARIIYRKKTKKSYLWESKSEKVLLLRELPSIIVTV
jgi:hypothetical protein